MQVIPAINETNFSGVQEKIKKAEEFLPQDGWVHIDIADGTFTAAATWNSPDELVGVKTNLNIELHLMVENPEAVLPDWLRALKAATNGKRRIIVHFEAMREPAFILDECAKNGAEAGLAFNPTTSPELVSIYLRSFNFVQVLAVPPGPSGQMFDPRVESKIKFLRSKSTNVIIEVDGGIKPDTARISKDAGADIVVSSSYIFGNPSPRAAYQELLQI